MQKKQAKWKLMAGKIQPQPLEIQPQKGTSKTKLEKSSKKAWQIVKPAVCLQSAFGKTKAAAKARVKKSSKKLHKKFAEMKKALTFAIAFEKQDKQTKRRRKKFKKI